jgi:predicted transcriptional regulator
MLNVTPELLEKISACAEIGNTIDQAATVLQVAAEDLTALLRDNSEARARWARGGIEATNQLKECLTRQALAGSVQAAVVLLKMRGELSESREKIALSSATTSTAKGKRGAAWRMAKISEVATELQVTAQYIRNMIRDASHPLPFEKRAGDWNVKAGEVYEWICKHAKRRPPNLTEPRGYGESKEESKKPSAGASGETETNPADLDVLKILTEVYGDAEASAEDKRTRISLAGELRRKIESDLKREKMMPLADVVKVLRSFGELLVETIEENSDALAADTIKVVRDRLDIDLCENPAAQTILKSAFCEQANKGLIPAIRQRVQDEVDGVQVLDLGAV